jgi:hypothetical protein
MLVAAYPTLKTSRLNRNLDEIGQPTAEFLIPALFLCFGQYKFMAVFVF